MQYRKLMEFFTEYQEEYMRQMQQLMTQKEVKVDEITRMMHTLKSNAKAIGAIHLYEIAKEMEDRGKQKDMENKEIAESMHYSYGYVKNLVAKIFSKLEIEKHRELKKLMVKE